MLRNPLPWSLGLCFLLGSPLMAAPPTVTHFFPAGVERGKAATIGVAGTLEPWPVEVWIDRPGVKITPAGEKGKLSVEAAANAEPGVYWVRLFNAEGAAAVRPLIVGTLAELTEKEPNDRAIEATPLTASAMTVNGQLAAKGDVDTFAIEARKGQVLVAAMTAHEGLGSPMDASLQVLSPQGFVLAQNDDDAALDPLLTFVVPADGKYLVRTFAFPSAPDSSIHYAGDPKFVYRLTITTGGFLDHVFPLAVARGAANELRASGWNLKDELLLKPTLPEFPPEGPLFGREETALAWQADLAGLAMARIVPQGPLVEQEPNDTAKPQAVTLPAYVSGRLSEAKDGDAFRFDAKKGSKLELRVAARAIGSQLDAVIKVLASDGKQLAQADDVKESRDAVLAFAAPSDGAYTVEVGDLHRRGGVRFVYLLSIEPATSDATVSTTAESFTVVEGKSIEVPLTIERDAGYAGELEISAVGLPDGVTAAPVKSLPKDATAKAVKLVLKSEKGTYRGPLTLVAKEDGGMVRRVRTPLAGLGTSSAALWLTVTAPPPPTTEKKEEKKE